MNEVNKTLYIPLYGKALVSRKGILLNDPTAEAIWDSAAFPLKGKARSKWLAYYMAMRASVFDRWTQAQLGQYPNDPVLHLGCGLDSRCLRVAAERTCWYDVDLPAVIEERKKHYPLSEGYRMLCADLRETAWLEQVEGESATVILEGVCMYLSEQELKQLLAALTRRFQRVRILLDHYTVLAARLSRYKNPINTVGVTKVWGMDDPHCLEQGQLKLVAEHDMTPPDMIALLDSKEQRIFRTFYGGSFARKLYRMYEYRKEV